MKASEMSPDMEVFMRKQYDAYVAFMDKQQEEYIAFCETTKQESIFTLMPAWKDKAVWERDKLRIREFAKTQGYSEDQVKAITDPKEVMSLWKRLNFKVVGDE
jgi:ABC-type Zn uptake system ZnuABC Zn-binding protein ZnuA